MTYDKKHVTPSFRDALSDVLGIKKEQALEEMDAGKPGPKRAAKIADGKVDAIKPWEHKTSNEEVEAEAELTEEQEELTEEEIFDILAEEFTPHIEKLIDEGFSDEEITEIIVEMINTEDEEEAEKKSLANEDEQLDEISKKKFTINDRERNLWIDNDEGLYNWHRSSRQSKRDFIRANKSEIDKHIHKSINRKPSG